MEYEFKSLDRADLVCTDSSGIPVAVEVKPTESECERGLWQAVKYKHLLAAERGLPCSQVRAFLVAPRIPDYVKQQCGRLGIEPKEIALPA